MAVINIFLILSLLCLCLYSVGVINYLTKYEHNSCRMTYMYEYPQFIKIDVPESTRYSRYGLYAYSEGRLTEKARNMIFDGIPVLFIPGNGGSYKQVRSLASVSLRKYLNSRTRFHFDYFTVDLNEELSALFGGVLDIQSRFVNHSIHAILNLYKTRPDAPETVILIGHSMGGITAQNVLSISNNSKLVNTILTLAAPNRSPIVASDPLIPEFYSKTYNYWDKNRQQTFTKDKVQKKLTQKQIIDNDKLTVIHNENKTVTNNEDMSKILLITIGGGMRDILVPSGFTYSRFGNINVLTTSIPRVWLSTDHQCIVWCLQLVLVLNRCLFNMVDVKTRQISTDFETRYKAAANLLTTTQEPAHTKTIYFHSDGDWIEDNRRSFSVRYMKGLSKTRYQMVRLIESHLHQMIAVEVLNIDDDDWIFGCAAVHTRGDSRVCIDGLSLSNHTRLLPSVRYSRRIVYMDLHKIKRKNPSWTHVIFKMSPTSDPIQLNFDIYNRDERLIKTSAPRLMSMSSVEVLSETPPNVVHYDVTIASFTSIYQALNLDVKISQCESKTYHVVAQMYVPWSPGHSSVHYFTETQTNPMSLRLHQTHQPAHNTSNNVRIRFVLDPNCKYTISLKSSLVDSLGQLARHYSLNILPYLASILILALRQQILQIRIDGKCSNLLTAITTGAKPYYVVTVAKLAQKFVSSDPTMPMLLPLGCFATAWALVYIIGLITYAGIAFAGKAAHFLMLRIITIGFSGWALNGAQRLPIAMGVFLIALGAATCGGVTLFAATLFYTVLLSKMYEDYMDNIVFSTVRKVAKKFISKTDTTATAETENINSNKTTDDKLTDRTENKVTKMELNECDKSDELRSSQDTPEITENESSKYIDKENTENTKQTDKEIVEHVDQRLVESTKQVDKENIESTQLLEKENIELKDKSSSSGLVNKVLNKVVDVVLPESDITLSDIHFHLTIFLILLLTTFLNVPSLLTWSHNFKYNPSLDPDPSFFTALVVGISVSMIWQMEVPKINLPFSLELGYILYALAAGTLIFSSVALYTINYFLATTLVLVTVHQCIDKLGFKERNEDDNSNTNPESSEQTNTKDDIEEEDGQNISSKYKLMKTKLQDDSM